MFMPEEKNRTFFANGMPYDENLKDKCPGCNGHGYTKWQKDDGVYIDKLCDKCKGSGIFVEKEVQMQFVNDLLEEVERIVDGLFGCANPETTMALVDFTSKRFGDVDSKDGRTYYNDDPIFMRDTLVIPASDDRSRVICGNTIILKSYFDAAMRICASFGTGGKKRWEDVPIFVSDKRFSPVVFKIDEIHAIVVATLVPIELPELDDAVKKIQAMQELIKKENENV